MAHARATSVIFRGSRTIAAVADLRSGAVQIRRRSLLAAGCTEVGSLWEHVGCLMHGAPLIAAWSGIPPRSAFQKPSATGDGRAAALYTRFSIRAAAATQQ